MASFITPIPPSRADWMGCGACINGSTAPPRDATRRASGGAVTTNMAGAENGRAEHHPMGSERAFLATAALLFTLSAAVTLVWPVAMSGMGNMAMPGGWTMSMTWMRMGGDTWLEAAASFLVMWIVMMAAMMLPALVPMLRQY